jgi:hypothetical protein
MTNTPTSPGTTESAPELDSEHPDTPAILRMWAAIGLLIECRAKEDTWETAPEYELNGAKPDHRHALEDWIKKDRDDPESKWFYRIKQPGS